MAVDHDILLETGTNEVEVAEFEMYLADGERKQSFGINVAKVREIIKFPNYTSMPNTGENVIGIFKFRDHIVPLVDLASWLNEYTERDYSKCYVVVTEFNQKYFGFIIHNIKRIHRMSWQEILSPKEVTDKSEKRSVTGVIKFEDRIVMMIDFEKIVADINPELSLSVEADKNVIEQVKQNGGKKALVAEDSGIVKDLLVSVLKKGGFEVISVNNGKQAYSYVEELSQQAKKEKKKLTDYVQVLVTDIEMPQMDGHSLCKKIKDNKETKTLPVVLFSSLIYEEIKKKGEQIGADAQISKPQIGNLLNIINNLLKNGT
ncbi:MAG: chemotaxis protein [Nanobdellota archaeon]